MDLCKEGHVLMRSSILHSHLFAGYGGGGRIWRSIKLSFSHGGRMLMSTTASSSPWLMLPPGRDSSSGDMIHNFYSLTENRHLSFGGGFATVEGTRFVGSSHGWLALFDALNNHLFVTNPLTGRRIDLPPVDKLPDPEINLRNGRASVSKVILSCSPDEDEWHAAMTFGPGNRLAFCSAARNRNWSPIGRLYPQGRDDPYKRFGRNYEDFVYCRPGKSFICSPYDMYRDCTEYWFVGGDPRYREVVTSIERPLWSEEIPEELAPGPSWFFIRHLVFVEEMNQQLLLVVVRFVRDKKPHDTFGFAVFRAENGHGSVNRLRWLRPDRGDSLDGLAIFIGINHSFAVAAADFPNIKPNSIYFTHSNWNFTSPDSVEGCDDIGVFDFETETVSPCCSHYPSQPIVHPPLWFTPTTTPTPTPY